MRRSFAAKRSRRERARLRRSGDRLRARPRRRSPELFEVVVSAHRRLHDVNHDVAGIDEHPVASLLAFDADDRRAAGLEAVSDVVGKRLGLARGLRGGNDQRVVQAGELANIEYDDVAGFDVFEGGNCDILDLAKAHPVGTDTIGCGQYKPEPPPEANRRSPPARGVRGRAHPGSQSPISAGASPPADISHPPADGTGAT